MAVRLPFIVSRFSQSRTILTNTGSLVGSIAATSVLGFPYWWIAARAFPASAVGYAAATISAMMLLGTVGMLGLGTLLTGELARSEGDRVRVLSTATMCAASAGLVVGLAFSLAAPQLLGLHALAGRIGPIVLFASGVGLTSATLVIDLALVGLLRGSLQLRRNLVFAVSKLAVLGIVWMVAVRGGGPALYATWVAGLIVSMAWLAFHGWREGIRFRQCRPQWSLLRHWRRTAVEHHFLNLGLQAPTLAMPLVASAAISVTASAYYYTASLITGFLSYGAIALTYALYAVAARDERRLGEALWFTVPLAFGVVLAANVVLLVGAPMILRVFGSAYADHATIVLRINGIYVFLMVVKDHYIAIARIRGTLLKAAVWCTTGAVLEIGLASAGAAYGGLPWLAVGGLAGLALEMGVMFPTVVRELRKGRSGPGPGADLGRVPNRLCLNADRR